jgi:rSAM/selenodomain-associated transferase 1
MKGHLVIMARRPQRGRGKRRLARQAGDLAAWRFQRAQLGRLARGLTGDPRWVSWLAVTPDAALATPEVFPRGDYLLTAQGDGDLGQRMARLLLTLPRGPVVIVGSDVPGIARSDVAAAFKALGRDDWVLGPSPDGGFWLIGARRRPKTVLPFAGVRWSSEHALADTLAGIARLGGRAALLRELRDVDGPDDLRVVTGR